MKKFLVTVTQTFTMEFEDEAESKEDMIKKVEEAYADHELSPTDEGELDHNITVEEII